MSNGKEDKSTNVIFKILSEAFLKTKKHARTLRKILAAFLHEHWVSLYPHWNYEGGHQLPGMCSLSLAAGQCKWPLPVNVSAYLFQTVIIVQSDSGNCAYFGPLNANRVIRLHCYENIDSQEPNFKIVSDNAEFKMAPPHHLEHVEHGMHPAKGFARTASSRFREARPEDDIATHDKAQTNMALPSDEHVEPDHAAARGEPHGADEAGIVALVTRAVPDQLSACQHAPLSDLRAGHDYPSAALAPGYGVEEEDKDGGGEFEDVEDWDGEIEEDGAKVGEIEDNEAQDGEIEDDEAQDGDIEDYADQQDDDRDDEASDEAARSDIKREIFSECERKGESAKSENQCFGKSESQKDENCESGEEETENSYKPLLWEDLEYDEEGRHKMRITGKVTRLVNCLHTHVMGILDVFNRSSKRTVEDQIEALQRCVFFGNDFDKVECRCGNGYLIGSWYTFPKLHPEWSSILFDTFLIRIVALEPKKRENTDLWHWLHMLPLNLWVPEVSLNDRIPKDPSRESRKQWNKLYGKHRKMIHQRSKNLQKKKIKNNWGQAIFYSFYSI